MSDSKKSEEDLGVLFADALVEDTLEADLLLRYARDPDALDPSDRQRVDAYLAASPAHRQQLRSLVRFAQARSELVAGARSESGGGSGEAALTSISSHPRWRTRGALIGAALAASLLAVLLYGQQNRPGAGEGPGSRLAREDSAAPESQHPPVFIVPVPESVQGPSDREPEPQLAHEGEPGALENAHPAPPAQTEPAPDSQLAESTAPSTPAPAPVRDERAESAAAAPPERETHEPVLLAMNIAGPLAYARPDDAIELGFLGGLRDARPGLPELEALAPSHVARTVNASPSLYFYLSEDTNRPIAIALADRVSIDPLLELRIEPPLAAGVHQVDLAEHDVVLVPGEEYRWFVSLAEEGGFASEDGVVRGAVRRVEPDFSLEAALGDASPGEYGRIYAERGLWYDALAFISGAIDRDPDDARLRELRAGLLREVGLSEAAEYDRRIAERTRH